MLAELIAILVVIFFVYWPAKYLLHLALEYGGAARMLAYAVLLAAGTLIVWLLSPLSPGMANQERIVFFIRAWGILFMIAGILAIGVAVVARLRTHSQSHTDE